MASSLLVMSNEVVYQIGQRTDLATIAKTWVNRSYQWLQDVVEFPESQATATIATIISTASYSLPADFFASRSVRNNTLNRKLNQISLENYARLSTASHATPTRYATRARTTLLVWPIPVAIEQLQLEYRKRLPSLTADGDLPLTPEAFEEVIILGAVAYGFDYNNEHERALMTRRNRRAILSELTDRLADDLTDRDEPLAPIGIQTGVVA